MRLWCGTREKRRASNRWIEFLIIKLHELTPITDVPDAVKCLKAEKRAVYFVDAKVIKFLLPSGLPEGTTYLAFPKELERVGELLVLGTSRIERLCLFDIHPKEGRVDVFPQDWFNEGEFDYGYQWVTRVAREPRSGKVYGMVS